MILESFSFNNKNRSKAGHGRGSTAAQSTRRLPRMPFSTTTTAATIIIPLLLLTTVQQLESRRIDYLDTTSHDLIQKPLRHKELDSDSVSRLVRLFQDGPNASVHFNFYQEPKTHATLLSVHARHGLPVLEFETNTEETSRALGFIELRFRTRRRYDTWLRVQTNMTHGEWHRLTLSLIRQQVIITLDCVVIANESRPNLYLGELFETFSKPKVWIGQRNAYLDKLHGSFKSVVISEGNVWQGCSPSEQKGMRPVVLRKRTKVTDHRPRDQLNQIDGEESSSTTTSSLFKPNAKSLGKSKPSLKESKDVAYLKHKVGYLENEFKRWRNLVQTYGKELRHVQLHQRRCRVESKELADGERWDDQEHCTSCVCHKGQTHCSAMGCPKLDCSNPVKTEGKCCPTCARSCYHDGTMYDHGSVFRPEASECVVCECNDSRLRCHAKENMKCPSLSCPRSQQVVPDHHCCPVCKGSDFCADMKCSSNATCSNGELEGKCRCKEGFYGNGKECFDLDECQWNEDIREQLGGCGAGTRCINQPGSFKCECLPGFIRVDDRNCLDIVIV